jgi:hypothetical protein
MTAHTTSKPDSLTGATEPLWFPETKVTGHTVESLMARSLGFFFSKQADLATTQNDIKQAATKLPQHGRLNVYVDLCAVVQNAFKKEWISTDEAESILTTLAEEIKPGIFAPR